MKSDVKIGIALGIIVAVGAIIWFTMRGEKTDTPSPVIVVPETPVAKPTKAPAPSPAPAPVIPPVTPLPTTPASAPAATPTAQPATAAPTAPTPEPIPLPTTVAVPAGPAAPAPAAPPVAVKPVPQDKEQPKERFHTVASGETLTQIAEMYYGQGKHWKVIYEANRSVIKDPDILVAGKKLRIPYPEEIAAAKKP